MPKDAPPPPLTKLPMLHNDVDAAHARIREHHHNLTHINSRLDGIDRRTDRLESRMDQHFYDITSIKSGFETVQAQLSVNTDTVDRMAGRLDTMITRLDKHSAAEHEDQLAQTKRMEQLHRRIIRFTSALVIASLLAIAVLSEFDALKIVAKLLFS